MSSTTTGTSRQSRGGRVRSFGRRAVSLLLATGMTLASTVVMLTATPEKAAAVTSDHSFTDCAFRQGAGTDDQYAKAANTLCLIDFSGLTWTQGSQQITKKLGDYTITFGLRINLGEGANGSSQNTAYSGELTTETGDSSNYAFGSTYSNTKVFVPYSGDSSEPVIHTRHDSLLRTRLWRFHLDNISVKKSDGTTVPDYALSVVDAGRTGAFGTGTLHRVEGISIDDQVTGDHTKAFRLTPQNRYPDCGSQFSMPDVESGFAIASSDRQSRDFVCEGGWGGTSPGTFVATTASPKNLVISTYSEDDQHFAMALTMGRMAGTVASDTAYEKAATGQETTFDLRDYTKQGSTLTEVKRPTDGSSVPMVRPVGGNDGITYQDTLLYRSTAAGAQKNKVFDRYTPTWTCTIGSAAAVTIRDGDTVPPKGYTLTNDRTAGTSSLEVSNEANPSQAPVRCDLNWVSKYQPSSLSLGKTVNGTASGFDEVQLRTFQLNYACGDATGFSTTAYKQAYPDASLSGNVVVQKGQVAKPPSALPQGASCKLTETFPDGAPPARPGKNLDQTWTGAGSDDAATDTQSISPTNGTSTRRTRTIVLGATVNAVANNRYDYRTGTLVIKKQLLGDPVAEFELPKTYKFKMTCVGTSVKNQEFEFQISRNADDTATGGITKTDVPVARDCYIFPLTGLSTAESQRFAFVGRAVTLDGTKVPVTPTGDYAGYYKVRLDDYQSDASDPTKSVANMDIKTSYAYQLRDLKILKQLVGPGAGSAELANATFPVQYACTWGPNGQYAKTGSASITTNASSPVKIPDIAVGAKCRVWEEGTPAGNTVQLLSTKVSFTDPSDTTTTLTNDQAKTTAVATISTSTDALQNRVVVANEYAPLLGTVRLTKAVVNNGLAEASLPANYKLTFTCGSRSVQNGSGSVISVPLSGSAVLTPGQGLLLKASTGNSDWDSLVNDQSGSLGVPYGNTCSFNEGAPESGVAGVLWSTDVLSQKVTVNADTVDAQKTASVTVTNTFAAAGKGLTIQQKTTANQPLARPVTYALTCTYSNGSAIDLGQHASFTLSEDTPTHEVPATVVPEGSSCSFTETSTDNGQRTGANGTTFPATRSSEVTVADDDKVAGPVTFANLAKVSVPTVAIGDDTVLNVSHAYDYRYSTVDAVKVVNFDPATQQYISALRKDVKRTRVFTVTMVCTAPLGGSPDTSQTTVSQYHKDANGQLVANDPASLSTKVPQGSSCVAQEGPTTSAEGISVVQQVSVNGSTPSNQSQAFTVADGNNRVQLTNTYSRRLAKLTLNKRANLPADVAGQYQQAGKNIPFYTHTFTMDCHDPETGTGAAGVLLGTFTGTITGPGTFTFPNVPVGTTCHIVGDKFGTLDLELPDPSDSSVTLESHLAPKEVRWVVDSNDGTATIDTDFPGGVTESQYFSTVDNGSDGSVQNTVDLVNTYDFVQTQVSMTKDITATTEGMDLLEAKAATFDFTYQCKGVGYQTSTIGSGENRIKRRLTLADFSARTDNGDGTVTRTFTSPKASVPAGAWCTFNELPSTDTPPQLTHTVHNALQPDTTLDSGAIAHRAPGGTASGTENWGFLNRYTRRFVPVRIAMLQDGYLADAAAAGYKLGLTCANPGASSASVTVPLADADARASVADDAAPTRGSIVNLPVGASCTLSLADSPALAARTNLETTAGDRRPFVEFGTWTAGVASDDNPQVNPVNLPLDQVTPQMKDYSFTFNLAADLAAPNNGDVAMTVAAEAMHPRDRVSLTVVKQSTGTIGSGASFTFTSDCLADDQRTIKAGGQFSLPDVPVGTNCNIREVNDGVPSSEAELSVVQADTGDRIQVDEVTNENADGDQDGMHEVEITALPVASVEDTSSDGQPWTVTLLNSFPASLEVTKTIAGPALDIQPQGTPDGVPDTAVLAPTATAMRVTYTLTNTGSQPLDTITLTDPQMAGRTLTRVTTRTVARAVQDPYTVPASGVIDPAFCDLGDGTTLAPGASATCTFDASLSEPTSTYVDTRGTLTATAQARGTTLEASDTASYGAIRPVTGTLPVTGRQTLVWVLGIGVAVLLFGLWRYLRRRDEDGETPGQV